MNFKNKFYLWILLLGFISLCNAQSYKINFAPLNSITSKNDLFKVTQVVGQLVAGTSSNNDFQLRIGFIEQTNLVMTGLEDGQRELPTNYSLSQNFPNPFNPETRINYELPNSGYVQIKVYDMLGREVAQLVNKEQNAGYYSVSFNTQSIGLSSGIYIYRIHAGDFFQTKKMILMK